MSIVHDVAGMSDKIVRHTVIVEQAERGEIIEATERVTVGAARVTVQRLALATSRLSERARISGKSTLCARPEP